MNQPIGPSPELQIIDRLVRGDESALTWVLKNIVPGIGPMLSRRFKDSLSNEELEDVVSEALLKLWLNRKTLDAEKGDLQGWFYVIARNVALDHLRKARHEQDESAGAVLLVEGNGGLPLGYAEKAEAFARAFAKLNHRERKVVAPLFQSAREQPAARDLGRKLKLSEGGIRALRFRGLRKLKRALNEMGYCLTRQVSKSRRPEEGAGH